MEEIRLVPIGKVESTRSEMIDDNWDKENASIVIDVVFGAEALIGLSDFSHVEVTFYFNKVDKSKITMGARHPRNNTDWPKVGIFAQRGKNRPNRLGSTICEVIAVCGNVLQVRGLDAIDGTPVVDIKPVMVEFLPRKTVEQPEWSKEIMSNYW
ncbi:TPA: SAM-dependent methyltransferase [Vibrio diabolicus]